jgi:hypothetical protein
MGGAHGEKLCHPEHEQGVVRKKLQAYTKLDDDGLVIPGSRVVAQQDVLIGKVVPADDGTCIDTSLVARCDGIVDSVLVTTSAEGRGIAKVRVRSYRQPDIGDKFASRHGQKGVCGMKFMQQDLPWTREGISPDLIMNPHAVPSRMTIGHLKEGLLSKLAAVTGRRGDGTAFMGESVESIGDLLHAAGYQRHGNEVMYSGITGERLGFATFISPGPYYQVLKHQVCPPFFLFLLEHVIFDMKIGDRQDPFARARSDAGRDAPAERGKEPRRRAAFGRDGARLPDLPRRRVAHGRTAPVQLRRVARADLPRVRLYRHQERRARAQLLPRVPRERDD